MINALKKKKKRKKDCYKTAIRAAVKAVEGHS